MCWWLLNSFNELVKAFNKEFKWFLMIPTDFKGMPKDLDWRELGVYEQVDKAGGIMKRVNNNQMKSQLF